MAERDGQRGEQGGAAGAEGQAQSPWPDRLAMVAVAVIALAVTVLWQRPKGAGLYGEIYFCLMVALALAVAYGFLKRALGLGPVRLRGAPRAGR